MRNGITLMPRGGQWRRQEAARFLSCWDAAVFVFSRQKVAGARPVSRSTPRGRGGIGPCPAPAGGGVTGTEGTGRLVAGSSQQPGAGGVGTAGRRSLSSFCYGWAAPGNSRPAVR